MFKKLMFKFGFISIKDVISEIDNLSKNVSNLNPSVKFKDGNKNVIFFKEQDLRHKFTSQLFDLKMHLKTYYL